MTDIPRYDFHIHTKYLGCADGTMEVPAIARECEQLGVRSLGITDHLNSLDRLPLHKPIRQDIEALDTEIAIYFGVELNFLTVDGGFAYSAEIKEQYGFQFAIGGIHNSYLNTYDLKKIVDIQHRHHLRTCREALVDVLVHPYWFHKVEFTGKGWPWFDSMQAVPESYARELGQVAKETGTAIEINATANLENKDYSDRFVKEYIDFLAAVAAEGACFALGSDAHNIGRLQAIRAAWQVAAQLGLSAERIWRPSSAPAMGGKTKGHFGSPCAP
ncbi:MAG: PHP domain-containing protein [Lentisphaerae bacterium]|nr:PHP domain-containing protein [Lentisphaerota bacterium]